jgi:hypothetical protein
MTGAGWGQSLDTKDYEITTFELLVPGDVFTFRPDFGIWFMVVNRPKVHDSRTERYVLETEGHGLSFANKGARVAVITREAWEALLRKNSAAE